MKKSTNNFLPALVVVSLLAIPVICLASTLADAPVRTAADAAVVDTDISGAADWTSAVMVIVAAGAVAWVVVSLNLRGRFGRPSNQTGGDADYQRRFFQPVESDPLWQAAHTDMVVTGDMTPIPGDLSGRWINLNPHHPSPTPTNTPERGKPGKPHAARREKAGER